MIIFVLYYILLQMILLVTQIIPKEANDDQCGSCVLGLEDTGCKSSAQPSFYEHVGPSENPQHGPDPAKETLYMFSGDGFESLLEEDAYAHEEEEADDRDEIDASAHAP